MWRVCVCNLLLYHVQYVLLFRYYFNFGKCNKFPTNLFYSFLSVLRYCNSEF